MKKIILTESQINFIKENYESKSLKEMASYLKISVKVLDRICKENGLKNQKKNPPKTVMTDEIQRKIKEIYATTRSTDICKMFNLNPGTLQEFATTNGLRKAKGLPRNRGVKEILTKEQKEFLWKNFAYYSNQELSDKIKAPVEAIRAYACNMGLSKKKDVCSSVPYAFDYYLEKRSRDDYRVEDFLGHEQEKFLEQDFLYKAPTGKHFVNKDYFEKIDTEWKAYWLGFLYADGCNDFSNCCVRLKLQKSDIDLLQKFKKSLQSTAPIKTFWAKERVIQNRRIDPKENCEIIICCKKMCEDLIKHGCVPNKTYSLQFPSFDVVPENLFRHFIRGFLDGDGWTCCNLEKKMVSIGFVGINSFITPLCDYLVKTLGIENIKVKPQPDTVAVEISWGGLYDCEKIYNFLYNDANIFLRRKLDKLDKILCLGQYEV